jgi:hypothetical protein
MIFVVENNYAFVPNFCMRSLYAKMNYRWINYNFIFIRSIYS